MTSDRHTIRFDLWRRDFGYVWIGESASLLGSQILLLALPLTAVTMLDATAGQIGLLGAATFAPYLLIGLPAGMLADRVSRRAILVFSNLGQMVAIGSIPLMAALGRLTFAWLLIAAFVAGFMRVFFTVAYRSYLPAIVPTEHLTGANARLTVSESVAQIGGPGIGGVLVQWLGGPYALIVDAASYLASALGFAAVRQRERKPPPDPTPMRLQLVQGFRFVFTNRYVRAFLGEAASYNLCWQVIQAVLVLFAVRELGMSPSTLGLMLSLGAIGAIIGAASTKHIADRAGLGRTLIAAAIIGDLGPLLLPTAFRGVWAAPIFAVAFFIQGFGATACNVHAISIRQMITPVQLLGRANAAYLFIALGVQPIGSLAGGWLGDTIGLRTTLLIGTLGLLSTCLFIIFSPVRRVRSLGDLIEPAAPALQRQL
jgi:MFS family permease